MNSTGHSPCRETFVLRLAALEFQREHHPVGGLKRGPRHSRLASANLSNSTSFGSFAVECGIPSGRCLLGSSMGFPSRLRTVQKESLQYGAPILFFFRWSPRRVGVRGPPPFFRWHCRKPLRVLGSAHEGTFVRRASALLGIYLRLEQRWSCSGHGFRRRCLSRGTTRWELERVATAYGAEHQPHRTLSAPSALDVAQGTAPPSCQTLRSGHRRSSPQNATSP